MGNKCSRKKSRDPRGLLTRGRGSSNRTICDQDNLPAQENDGELTLKEAIRRLEVAYGQSIVYAEQLTEAVMQRRRVEEDLHRTGAALTAQALRLDEVNTALKVLLKRREQDRKEIEERLLLSVKRLVAPYVEALKNTPLNTRQAACVALIESRLNDLISPFAKTLSSKYLALTPKEIEVAGFIKEGKTTKEIARFLHVSARAVDFHRDNIRRKLGLKNKKANLRSHLLSLE